MKRLINFSVILLALVVLSNAAFAQTQNKFQEKRLIKTQNMVEDGQMGVNWIDANGDGICDNFGTEKQGNRQGNGAKNGNKGGYGDGSGVRPQDGTGLGSGNGSGVCDGTGPKGSSKRAGRK